MWKISLTFKNSFCTFSNSQKFLGNALCVNKNTLVLIKNAFIYAVIWPQREKEPVRQKLNTDIEIFHNKSSSMFIYYYLFLQMNVLPLTIHTQKKKKTFISKSRVLVTWKEKNIFHQLSLKTKCNKSFLYSLESIYSLNHVNWCYMRCNY